MVVSGRSSDASSSSAGVLTNRRSPLLSRPGAWLLRLAAELLWWVCRVASGAVLVSIVMAAYDTEEYVADAVRSVLASTYWRLELIVVDDGSNDRTLERAEQAAAGDPRVRLLSRPHRGARAAMAEAHDVARGEVIGSVDSDDVLMPSAIERCLRRLDGGHELVYSWRRLVDAEGRDRGSHDRNRIVFSPMRHLVSNMVFHFRLYTRDLFDRCGGLSDLEAAIDWDLSCGWPS